MKRIGTFIFFIVAGFIFLANSFAANAEVKKFESSGEVTAVSPLFSRISITHDAIKGFAGDGDTEFAVSSKDLLKNISTGDLVRFTIVDERGDVRIEKIEKTGVAPVKEKDLPIGRAVQGVLKETGEAVNTLTQPVMPVNEVANSAMGATTSTTGSVLNDANPEIKQNF